MAVDAEEDDELDPESVFVDELLLEPDEEPELAEFEELLDESDAPEELELPDCELEELDELFVEEFDELLEEPLEDEPPLPLGFELGIIITTIAPIRIRTTTMPAIIKGKFLLFFGAGCWVWLS